MPDPETSDPRSELRPAEGPVPAEAQIETAHRPDVGGPTAEISEPAAEELEQATSKKLGVIGWMAIVWLVLIAVMALVPFIFPFGELGERNIEALRDETGITLEHPMGIDTRGEDLLTRVIHGTRASMIVSVGAVVFGLVVGGFLGLVSGYFRGPLDTIAVNLFNVMLSIPALVLALTLAAVLTSAEDISYLRRVGVVTLAIGIVSVPILGRITRASTLTWAEREFVIASEAMGARSSRIIWREVLPNVLPAMFSISLLGVAVAIITEGGLAVIGVGVPPGLDSPSWGNLIATGRSQMLLGNPHLVMGPSLFIFFTVLSLNYLGDVIRARFDVRESVL